MIKFPKLGLWTRQARKTRKQPSPTKQRKPLQRHSRPQKRSRFKIHDNETKTYKAKRTPEEVRAFAEECRQDRLRKPTAAETAFAELLRDQGLVEGRDYEREKIFYYNEGTRFIIADFFIEKGSQKLVIEIDGPTHAAQSGFDSGRDRWLAGQCIQTLRFTNRKILKTPQAVQAKIIEALNGT